MIYRNDVEDPFGTFEYIPYLPHTFYETNQTSLENVFSFKDIERFKETNYSYVFELDKLVVSKKYRNAQNLGLIIMAVIEVGQKLNAKTLLTLIRPSFFRLLERTFKIPISQEGEKVFYEPDNAWLIPAIIDAELVIHHKEECLDKIRNIINNLN